MRSEVSRQAMGLLRSVLWMQSGSRRDTNPNGLSIVSGEWTTARELEAAGLVVTAENGNLLHVVATTAGCRAAGLRKDEAAAAVDWARVALDRAAQRYEASAAARRRALEVLK